MSGFDGVTWRRLLVLCRIVLVLPCAAALPAPGVVYSWAFHNNATFVYSHSSSFVRVPSSLSSSVSSASSTTSSGTILAVFQASQSKEGAATQEKLIVQSTDGGATWSDAVVLVPHSNASSGAVVVPWDGSIFIDDAGAVRCVFSTNEVGVISAGDIYTISSADGGATWSAPSVVVPRTTWGRSMATLNPPVALPSSSSPPRAGGGAAAGGRLAMPVETIAGVPGDHGPVTAGLVVVGGDGETWTPLGVVPSDMANISTFLEPAVAVCPPPNGEQLLMLMRTNIQQLWAARSTDAGATWSVAYRTPFANPDSKVTLVQWQASTPPAHGNSNSDTNSNSNSNSNGSNKGLLLSDGDLLLVLNPYSNCSSPSGYCPRTPLSIAVSRDCGGSWGPLYHVEEGPGSFHYPTARQCVDDATGAPAICMTYSVTTTTTDATTGATTTEAGIRYAVVPAANLLLPPPPPP
jgi:hypothetical protein